MTYASVGKSGRIYHLASYNIVCRRSIPTTCHECGEMMYEESTDEIRSYDIVTFACRNGHIRTVFIDKKEA